MLSRQSDALLNRGNYQDTRAFLCYRSEVRLNETETVDFARGALDHLMRWAAQIPLPQAADIRPTLPAYLESLGPRSLKYCGKILANIRDFFLYACETWPERYTLKRHFLDSLRLKKRLGRPEEKLVYTLGMVRDLLQVEWNTL